MQCEEDTDTLECISETHEMNLCSYRAQIGLAPHEAALDLLIIVLKRMKKEEARGIQNEGTEWQQFNSFAKNEIAITHWIFMAIAQPKSML